MGRRYVLRNLIVYAALCGVLAAVQLIVTAAVPPTSNGGRSSKQKPSTPAAGSVRPAAPTSERKERTPASRTWRRVQQQGFFSVSLDPDNLPYSARKGNLDGFEVELVHALAKQLGLTAKIDWITVRHETSLGKLLDGECDLVMGLPVDPRLRDDDDPAAGRILYTRPYYRTGYLIFVRKNGPRIIGLKALKGGATRRVGTQAGTLADFALKQRGYRRKLYGTQQSVLKALAAGRIDYAYLWSNATWIARNSPELGVEIVQPYELEDWRNMAAAVRRGDDQFRRQLEEALAQLVSEKFIERLLSRYGMPYYRAIEKRQKGATPVDSRQTKTSRIPSQP